MNAPKWLKVIGGAVVVVVFLLVAAYLYFDEEKILLNDQVRSTLPGQFVELPNGIVHYELTGPQDAPTVVLVHGFSVPYYVWDPTFDALVDAGFQVLRYDLYGRGYSDRPQAEYNLDLFTEQLLHLLSALNIEEPVDLVGLSMGGPIIAAFSNQHPDRVHRLCLISPQAAPVPSIFPLNVPVVGEYLMGAYIVPIMLPQAQSGDFYKPERFPDWEDKYRVQMKYKGFRRALLSTMRNMTKLDAIVEYESIGERKCPVLLLWGREDQTISFQDVEMVLQAIPDAEFHPIDEAGHLSHYEQPGVVNPLLIEFLGS